MIAALKHLLSASRPARPGTDEPATPTPAIRMSPGMFQTIYLNSAGSVFAMGSDNQGQLGNG